MLASVVRRQSGGLIASLTPYLRSSAAATSRGFAAAAEEQVREARFFRWPFNATEGCSIRRAFLLPSQGISARRTNARDFERVFSMRQ